MKRNKGSVGGARDHILAKIPEACVSEAAAVDLVESLRWGDDPHCVHCESRRVYKMKDSTTGDRNKRFLWRCHDCGRQYSVRIGTIFEDSRIPMRIWTHIFWRACSSKKGVAALQIARETGLSYKSALFAMHRVRCTMATDPSKPPKLSGIVEADETYVGGKPRFGAGRNPVTGSLRYGRGTKKTAVMGIVQRGGGVRLRTLDRVTAPCLQSAIWEVVDQERTTVLTDEFRAYGAVGLRVSGGHHTVKHSAREYVRGEIHTNTVESVFSLIKRGLVGTFHSVSKRHLHRYLSEFEHRWNTRYLTDGERTAVTIRQAEGKRLMYKQPVTV